MKNHLHILLVLGLLILFVGCSGGTGGEKNGNSDNFTYGNSNNNIGKNDNSNNFSDENSNNSNELIQYSGRVVDGYIKGAVVCVDENSNGECDTNEPQTTSDSDGRYTLYISNENEGKNIISVGGIDTTTNKSFSGKLKSIVDLSDSEEKITSPVTTYVAEIKETNNLSLDEATITVANAFGIDANNINKDPSEDTEAFKASQMIIQISSIIASIIKKDDATIEEDEIFEIVVKQMANSTNGNNKVSEVSETVIESVANEFESVTIDEQDKSVVRTITTELESSLETLNDENLNQVQSGLDSFITQTGEEIQSIDNMEKIEVDLPHIQEIEERGKAVRSIVTRTVTREKANASEEAIIDAKCGSRGGIAIFLGLDINADGDLQVEEYFSDASSSDSKVICNGLTGEDSETKTSLVDIVNEPEGNNCESGGQAINVGLDLDSNSILDASEITRTSYVCNGTSDVDNLSKSSSIVQVLEVTNSEQCPNGGKSILSGFDSNGDGVLTEDENPTTSYICNGSDGTSQSSSLVEITSVEAGEQCANGGKAIKTGLDSNQDGVLTDVDTPSISYVCNGTDSTDRRSSDLINPIEYVATATIEGSINLSNFRSLVTTKKPEGTLWLSADSLTSSIAKPSESNTTGAKKLLTEPIEIVVDDNGTYSMANLPAGTNYSLTFIGGGTGFTGQGVKIGELFLIPGETTTQNITSAMMKTNGSAVINIKSLKTGLNLSDVDININELALAATTGTDGNITFENLPEGSYSLTIKKAGFVSKYMTFNVTSGQQTSLQTVELSSQKGSLVGSVRVSGQIDHSNVIVYARGVDGSVYTTLTNSEGLYKLPSVAVGEGYSVIATARDMKPAKMDNLVVTAGSVTGVATIILEDIDNDKGSIEGAIYFADKTTLDHQGIIISIEGTDYEAISAKDGSFIISDIPVGEYTLNFTDSNYISQTKTLTIVAGSSTKLEPILLRKSLGGVSGRVVDDSGNAVENAAVIITSVNGKETLFTDSNGEFSHIALQLGIQTLQVQKDGYIQNEPYNFEITKESSIHTITNDLELTYLKLTGTVDLIDISSDEGVTVSLLGTDISNAVTDTNGNFTLYGVGSGNYQLQVTKDNFVTQTVPILITQDESYEIPYTIEMNEAKGILKGFVTLNGSTQLSGAIVSILGTTYSTQTNDTGEWSMVIPKGEYSETIQYAKAGYNTQSIIASFSIEELATSTLDSIELTAETGTITGIIKDEESGTVIDGASVQVISNKVTISGFSGADGSFTLTGVPVGTQRVIAIGDGYGSGSANNVTVVAGATTNITATPIELSGKKLDGKVVVENASDNSGVTVELIGIPISSYTTTADGSFTLYGVGSGIYQLQLTKSGYKTEVIPITIVNSDGYIIPYDIELKEAVGSVGGVITLDNTNDNSGVTVTLEGTTYTTTTNYFGMWEMSVPVNTYSGIRITHPDYQTIDITSDVVVETSKTTTIIKQEMISKTASISGKVVDDGGTIVPNALLTITTLKDTKSTFSLNSDGTFLLSGVPLGEQTLHIQKDGYILETPINIDLTTEDTTIALDSDAVLNRLTLKGTIELSGESDHSGVDITLIGANGSATSITNGEFTMYAVGAGSYQLQVSKAGYITKTIPIVIIKNAAYTIPYTITLEKAEGVLTGIVNLLNNNNNSGVIVTVAGKATTTNSLGQFNIDMPINTYTDNISFTKEGYITTTYTDSFSINTSSITSIGTITMEPNKGSIKGVVKDDVGSAISSASISLKGDNGTFVDFTSSDGSFDITAVPYGEYTLTISRDSYSGYSNSDIVINSSSVLDKGDISLSRLTFKGKATLFDKSNHSNITLQLLGSNAGLGTITSNGDFTFYKVGSGTYQLEVSHTGYTTQIIPVSIVKDDNYELPYTIKLLKSEGELNGVVTLQNREDYSGVIITVKDSANNSYQTATNTLGQWKLPLPVGDFNSIQYSLAGYVNQTISSAFTLSGGEKITADSVKLQEEFGKISGRVVDESGNPVSGSVVNITISSKSLDYSTIATVNGSFNEFNQSVGTGTYTVTAHAIGYGSALETVEVYVDEINTTLVTSPLQLKTNIVKGSLELEDKGVNEHGNIDIALYQNSTEKYSAQSLADGTFEITNVVSGNYQVKINQTANSNYSSKIYNIQITGSDGYLFSETISLEKIDVVKDMDLLTFDYIKKDNSDINNIVSNLYLPTTMPNGSTITWTTVSGTHITTAGIVSVPATAGEAQTVLKATFNSDSTKTKEFTFKTDVGSVSGIIKYSSGSSVDTATVTLSGEKGVFEEITGVSGSFSFTAIPYGSYSLTVTKSHHTTYTRDITISEASSDQGNLIINELTFTGTAGLYDGDDNSSIILKLYGANLPNADINTKGEFSFKGVGIGTYQLQVSQEGYTTQLIPISIVKDENYELPYTIKLLKAEGELSGLVTLDNRNDYSGVIVTVKDNSNNSYQTATNTLGQWKLPLPVGDFTSIQYSLAGYLNQTTVSSFSLSTGESISVETINLEEELGEILGRVVDENGNPISNAVVNISISSESLDYSTIATVNGSFNEFSQNVGIGTYTVTANAVGYGSALSIVKVYVNESNTTLLTTTLQLETSKLKGALELEGLSNNNYGDIDIKLYQNSTEKYSSTSNSDGTFEISNVVSGYYQVKINQSANSSYNSKTYDIKVVGTDGYIFSETILLNKTDLIQDLDLLTFNYIKGENSDINNITSHLFLPTVMPNGSSVVWSVLSGTHISSTGVVTIPAQTTDSQTVLKATLNSDSSQTKEFTFKTIADYEPVFEDVSNINLPEDFGIYTKTFKATNKNGLAITYSLSNCNIDLFSYCSLDSESGELILQSKEDVNGSNTISISATSSDKTISQDILINISAVADLVTAIASTSSTTVSLNTLIDLIGSNSIDSDGDATYNWEFVSQPSNVIINNSTEADASFTPDKTGEYRVKLTVSNSKSSSSSEVTIMVLPTISITDIEITEGNSAIFTVSLSAHDNLVALNYETKDITAKKGSDYTYTSGTLTFASGETSKTITVNTIDDKLPESAENFKIVLSNISGATDINGDIVSTIEATATLPYAPLNLSQRTKLNSLLIKDTDICTSVWTQCYLSSFGDIDGDGFSDLAISGANYDNGSLDLGKVSIVKGSNNILTSELSVKTSDLASIIYHDDYGSTHSQYFGRSVSSAGDLDLDGKEDLLIGTKENYDKVFIIGSRGLTLSSSQTLNQFISNPDNNLTVISGVDSGTNIGDVNNDGYDDIMLSNTPCSSCGSGGSNDWKTYIVYGNSIKSSTSITDLVSSGNAIEITNTDATMEGIGDFNNDGYDDVAVVIRGNTQTSVIFGGSSLPSTISASSPGSNGIVISGYVGSLSGSTCSYNYSNDNQYISGGGDVNGDGINDLIIEGSMNYGTTYVIFGGSHLTSNLSVSSLNSTTGASFYYGGNVYDSPSSYVCNIDEPRGVEIVGDMNGDGIDDFAIGGHKEEEERGKVYIVYGSSSLGGNHNLHSLLNGSNGFEIIGENIGDKLGNMITSAGDFNGDSFKDVYIRMGGHGKGYIIYGGDYTNNITKVAYETSYLSTIDGSSDRDIILSGDYMTKTINSLGGADVLLGSMGKEEFIIKDFNFQKIDGGAMSNSFSEGDVITLDSYGDDIDLRVHKHKIKNINTLDISGTGSNKITLDYRTVKEMVSLNPITGYSELLLKGHADDTVFIADYADWSFDGDEDYYYKGNIRLKFQGLPEYPKFTLFDEEYNEGAGVATYKIERSEAGVSSSVDYTIVDGSAKNGVDFIATPSGTLEFNVGEYTKTIEIALVKDDAMGFNSDFNVTLSNPVNANIAKGVSTITINDATLQLTNLDGSNGFSIFTPYRKKVVNGIGDYNKDGKDDFISAISHTNHYIAEVGENRIFWGDTQLKNTVEFSGNYSNFTLHGEKDIAPIKDVNNDGYEDFVMGPIIYLGGASFDSNRKITFSSGASELGYAVSGVGDINGDDINDTVIGTKSNKAYVVFGSASLTSGSSFNLDTYCDGTNGFIIYGDDSYFSNRISSGGDINGDGFNDFLIGTSKNGDSKAYLIKGSNTIGSSGSINVTSLSTAEGFSIRALNRLGALEILGDTNGNGLDDMLVSGGVDIHGWYEYDYKAVVIYGSETDFDAITELDLHYIGDKGYSISDYSNTEFGQSVAKTGDINGDGYADIVINSAVTTQASEFAHVYIVYGNKIGQNTTYDLRSITPDIGFRLVGETSGDHFGYRSYGYYDGFGRKLSGVGDIDGDGYNDIIINAKNYGTDGKIYVIFGADFLGLGN